MRSLYDGFLASQARVAQLTNEVAALSAQLAHFRSLPESGQPVANHTATVPLTGEAAGLAAQLAHFHGLSGADRLIELDFPMKPRVRFGWDKPPHERLRQILSTGDDRYAEAIRSFERFLPQLQRIPLTTTDPAEPCWTNDWIPVFDAVSLYGFTAQRNPERYIEIGSGTSTKFVRKAIRDHGLRTRIISYDPSPRSEIDAICDEVIRSPLENADLGALLSAAGDDIVFCDNSHQSFQNSDVTTFFLDVLPNIQPGVLVGVHDIFLPHDYPEAWLRRFYNEQYLLAACLLGGTALRVVLPIFYCERHEHLKAAFDPFKQAKPLSSGVHTGGIFWVTPSPA